MKANRVTRMQISESFFVSISGVRFGLERSALLRRLTGKRDLFEFDKLIRVRVIEAIVVSYFRSCGPRKAEDSLSISAIGQLGTL